LWKTFSPISPEEKFGAIKLVDGKDVETLKVSGQTMTIPLVMGSTCKQKPDHSKQPVTSTPSNADL
jgi:hypothetical protein